MKGKIISIHSFYFSFFPLPSNSLLSSCPLKNFSFAVAAPVPIPATAAVGDSWSDKGQVGRVSLLLYPYWLTEYCFHSIHAFLYLGKCSPQDKPMGSKRNAVETHMYNKELNFLKMHNTEMKQKCKSGCTLLVSITRGVHTLIPFSLHLLCQEDDKSESTIVNSA